MTAIDWTQETCRIEANDRFTLTAGGHAVTYNGQECVTPFMIEIAPRYGDAAYDERERALAHRLIPVTGTDLLRLRDGINQMLSWYAGHDVWTGDVRERDAV